MEGEAGVFDRDQWRDHGGWAGGEIERVGGCAQYQCGAPGKPAAIAFSVRSEDFLLILCRAVLTLTSPSKYSQRRRPSTPPLKRPIRPYRVAQRAYNHAYCGLVTTHFVFRLLVHLAPPNPVPLSVSRSRLMPPPFRYRAVWVSLRALYSFPHG